ncbi:MAG TPA: hypothetical protein VF624_05455 [Tepidisphaeraceae bacterium]|jgi:hypothetical protein
MWGNTRGWIIAAVLFLLMGLGVFQAHRINQPSAPTRVGSNPAHFQFMELTVAPSAIVPFTQPGDTADLYRRAIADVMKNGSAYAAFERSVDPAVGRALPAVKLLLEATLIDSRSVLAPNLKDNIGYHADATPAELAALETAVNAVERTGLLLKAKPHEKLDEAKAYFEAEFATGARMFAERIRYMEAFKGLGRMRAAASELKQIAQRQKDAARAERLEAFDTAAQTLLDTRLTPMWKSIYVTDDKLVARYVGDAYAFASQQQKDRLWRIESILHLGRLQHNVGGGDGRAADQLAVKPTLAEMQKNERDPAIQAAITAAQNCTIQEFRTY